MAQRSDLYRTRKRLIHCTAHCLGCGWKELGYKVATRKARQHARDTGHTLVVEEGRSYSVWPARARTGAA